MRFHIRALKDPGFIFGSLPSRRARSEGGKLHYPAGAAAGEKLARARTWESPY